MTSNIITRGFSFINSFMNMVNLRHESKIRAGVIV